jgi:hypothetical protein
MATNFRLEGMQGGQYVDLFPVTSIGAILGATNALHIETLPVTINSPSNPTVVQDVAITTNAKMLDAPFECYLNDTSVDAQKAYATISQVQVIENTLKITRVGDMPQTAINVTLVFYEKGVDGVNG